MHSDFTYSKAPSHTWSTHSEGQLSVDVHETKNELIVVAPMAGALAQDLQINVNNDLLTIRGKREVPFDSALDQTHHTECYWGPFSRSIVLPVDVKGELSQAEYKNGVLVITIPKRSIHKKIPIKIVED
ncbi:Hsp20/alpha crystallin family protein [Candidatus Nomurabacteria bacterium]|nr:Hsp20/alpha crystallin family protein [Candidatus Nomurabacteria bacterium]